MMNKKEFAKKLFDIDKNMSDTPAEGAEAFLRSHKISGADFVYTTGFENMVELLREFAAQQQPTAEGAEEITAKEYLQNKYPQMRGHLWNSNEYINDDWIAEMMEGFATLHAQRIADKMVAENLVEFGNMIRDEPNGDIAALAEYFIRTINLKSR